MGTSAPIFDFVTEYLAKDMSRFHMPGHKGKNILGFEARDITEIEGADTLFDAEGIIAESERNASALFDTACTVYSCEGSTLAIKAMLRLAMQCTGKMRLKILAARNVHQSFVHACALLDCDTEWLFSETADSLSRCLITPERLAAVLDGMEERPDAVYITSPDYTGTMADIRGIAEVCHSRNILLLADNAHGAYLHFLEEPVHPMDLGADMCCDSAHKTLPVLTGGAYLHVSKRMAEQYGDLYRDAKKAMSLFASSSPSWLILQSLDLCNAYLAGDFRIHLAEMCNRVQTLKEELEAAGIRTELREPLKLLVDCASLGMTGTETAAFLRSRQIECEFADRYDLVLMVSAQNDGRDLSRLKNALCELAGKKPPLRREYPKMPEPVRVLSMREALLSPSVRLPLDEAAGRICASPSVSCPPAVPAAVSGELLSEEIINIMKWYGFGYADVTAA